MRHRSLLTFSFFLSVGLALLAQTYQGTIVGTVTDQTGAVIRNAKILVTNVGTNQSRAIVTNDAGEYTAPNLEPGKYKVTAESQGFQRVERINLTLEVARTIKVDFQLAPGASSETIEVSDEAPLVNMANAVLESTFTNNAIVQLPLQGRDFQNLVTLNPGVQRTPGGGFQSITSNGNRSEDNNFIVDGIDNNDAYYGTTVINAEGVQGTPATHLPVDAIQEFNVQSGPEAEYGWKPGAIVNIGIKSGTNDLHGTAYYFHRNSALDARNYFNPVTDPASTLRLHQFGGSIGGPIKKDKLFFFANYEGVRDMVGNPLQLRTPVTDSVGDLSSSTVSIADAVTRCTNNKNCNDLSLSLLPLFPFNHGTSNPADPTLLNMDFNNTNREDNGIAKLDYRHNQNHGFSLRYFAGDSYQNEEDANVLRQEWLSLAYTRAQVLGANWDWNPTNNIVNQLRFGYNRFGQQIFSGDYMKPASSYGINTGVTKPLDYGFPEINITPFNRLGGNSSWPLMTTPNVTYQITENMTWLKNRHSLKFGGEFRIGSTDNTRDRYGKGRIEFRSLDRFVRGSYRRGRIGVGDTHREVSQKSFGLYAQDDIRLTPRLTLTAGLRYDVSLPITEAQNRLANVDINNGFLQVGQQIDSPYNTDWNNFAPRLGFAWDLAGNGKTILRGGAGIIYEIPHISLFISQNGADALGLATIPTGGIGVVPGGGNITSGVLYPLYDLNWSTAGPVFGTIPNDPLFCNFDNQCSVLGFDRNLQTPYVMNWNLNIQHQFTNTTSLQLAYVANRGKKLYSLRDLNQNRFYEDWVANGMGDPYNDTDGKSGRPLINKYPWLGSLDMVENRDYSFYDGMQVTFRQRAYKGLDIVAGYTWAHAIDIYGSNRAYTWEDPNNPLLERGDATSDLRHRFTLAFTYATPKFARYDALLGGWVFNTIATFQTGAPRDLWDGDSAFSGSYNGNDRWNMFGNGGNLKWSLQGIPFYEKGSPGWNQYCAAYAPGLLPGMDPNTDYPTTSDYSGGCYYQNGTALVPPQWGSFGNMRRNAFRGPGYQDVDMSLAKTISVTERLKLQVRAEFFNIFNHPNFAGLEGDLETQAAGIPAYTPDVAASNPVVGSGGSRHVQLGLKFTW